MREPFGRLEKWRKAEGGRVNNREFRNPAFSYTRRINFYFETETVMKRSPFRSGKLIAEVSLKRLSPWALFSAQKKAHGMEIHSVEQKLEKQRKTLRHRRRFRGNNLVKQTRLLALSCYCALEHEAGTRFDAKAILTEEHCVLRNLHSEMIMQA